jgi:hypothetical protein
MDPQMRTFLWVLGSAGFFALLGGVFGAITGVVTWTSGRAAGSTLGLAVARAFARAAEKDLPPAIKGALIGGTDGFVFLGLVGVAAGAFAASRYPASWETFWPLALGGVLIAGGALCFGGLAYLLLRLGTAVVVGLSLGGMAGALSGFVLAGVDGLLPGLLTGAAVGIGAVALWQTGD